VTTADPPPWGTPDDPAPSTDGSAPAYGSAPASGSPPTSGSPPAYGSPATYDSPPAYDSSSAYGSPDSAPPTNPDLMNAEAVVVAENAAFLGPGGYDLMTSAQVMLGTVRQERSAAGWLLGEAASTTYRMFHVDGRLVASMLRPGRLGRSVFVVSDARDLEIGTVEQENAFMAPQFRLVTADGLVMRLTGGQFGSGEWQLVDGLDESVLMGLVHRQYGGLGQMLSGTDRFMVELSPQLQGGHRLLALMATICLDYVRDAKGG
jgi:hypothetical protein